MLFSSLSGRFKLNLKGIIQHTCTTSAAAMSIKKTKISQKLMLRTVDTGGDKPNLLVLFFPWLYATPSAIEKYCHLYHQRQMDVLCIDVELKHFLRPSTGQRFAKEILDHLNENCHQNSGFLVHAFSIGAYLYSIVLMELDKNPSSYNSVRSKICGQVFDSITVGGLSQMSEGVAGVTQNPLFKALLKVSTSTYFSLTKKYTVDFYEEAVYQFKYKPLRSPVQFFYCLNDPMASPEAMKQIIDLWREDEAFKMDVSVKCWEKSSHAGHLRKYPAEYVETLQNFLTSIDELKPVVTPLKSHL